VRFASRLVLGTFSIVALAVVVALGGRQHGVPGLVLMALPIALGLAWIAGRSIARPLVALSDAARDIAAGDTPRFPRSGIPEVDALVEALRRMHGDLASRALELQQERAGGNAIVDAMVEGVIAADTRGKILMANPAARRLLGYAPDVPLPDLRTLFRVKSARDAVIDVLAGREVHDCEVELDGRILSLNARPLYRNGAVLVLHDLTELRRLEAIRRDFVANVSHELKTPLTSIAGYAETLMDANIDVDTRRRFLETVVSNARRMQRLVDDLLDLSRIESGHWIPRIQHTALEPLVTDAWEAFRDRAAKRRVALDRAIAPDARYLDVDAEAFRQVLSNLFDNALRYVPVGGRIVCRSVRVDHGVAVSVEDDGGGIASEHLPRIFERFYRVDPARSRDEGGTGLGLAIVRHMIEAHGGRVDAESELQRGMTVRCWFPDQPADAAADAMLIAKAS
jgi:two-component system, OmpR family, phosphate regulon sensor histidine kinase PhoR